MVIVIQERSVRRQANTAYRDREHIRQILFFKTFEAPFSVISHAKMVLKYLAVITGHHLLLSGRLILGEIIPHTSICCLSNRDFDYIAYFVESQ